MDSIDVKGIAWVGNIYQKFEAMCLEVEEAMCQETAKYVENQVQTVGASMKRFCSDVMQDLLPPSSKDLSKVASAELLLNPYLEFGIHMKPVSTFKEDVTVKDPVIVKGISEDKNGISKDKKSNSSNNDAWEDWSFNWEISDKDEAKCEQMSVEASNEDIEWETRGGQEGQICNLTMGTSSTSFAKSSTKGAKRSRSRSECISSNNIIRAEDTNTGSSEAQNDPDLEEENNTTTGDGDVSELGFEFEDTCVLVDGNDYHHHPIPIHINNKEETRCSYKKKIQGAFSLKNKSKSARKQEYKQLVAVAEYDKNLTFSDNNKKPPDSIESEWELL